MSNLQWESITLSLTFMDEFIKDLLRKNFTARTIKARCTKKGWTVTDDKIEALRGLIELELKAERLAKETKSKSKDKEIVRLFDEQESYFDFAKRVGVNLEIGDTVELISKVQKITADIFIRQSLCYMRALELQSEGVFIDMTMFVRGYEVALKGLCLAWGIQNLIDVNAAFQCLESKGYLSKNNALSEISEIHQSN